MMFWEAVKAAWLEIRNHKFRSALSFAALAVGTASTLYTFAQTHQMNEAHKKAVELMGPGSITISAKRNYVSRGLSSGLIYEDARAIRDAMPELYMIWPKARLWSSRVYYGRMEAKEVRVDGINSEWRRRNWVFKLRGRFLNERDVQEFERVCVILEPGGWYKKPYWAAWMTPSEFEGLASHHDLLGKTIRIDHHDFVVVGSLKEPPKDLDPRWWSKWDEANVLVPITAFHRYVRRGGRGAFPTAIDEIQVDTGDERTLPEAKRRIDEILKHRHRGEEDYEINDNRQTIQEQLNRSKSYTLAATVLGAVALFAGGIGIMNVTLAALFSRVKEIGIRRAIGASRLDILAQFVIEASLLGLLGGLAGIGLGVAGIFYLGRESEKMMASLTWYHMTGVVLISVAVGGSFALVPAWQASSLDPVAAIKEE